MRKTTLTTQSHLSGFPYKHEFKDIDEENKQGSDG